MLLKGSQSCYTSVKRKANNPVTQQAPTVRWGEVEALLQVGYGQVTTKV